VGQIDYQFNLDSAINETSQKWNLACCRDLARTRWRYLRLPPTIAGSPIFLQ
jgi:hypothetical protein